MDAQWIKSPTGRRVLEHWADPRPSWLWSADGHTLLWRNLTARLFPGRGRKGQWSAPEAMPIRGQISRLIRLGSLNRASLSRMQFVAGERPISATCACTPLQLPDGQTALLVVYVDPIAGELLDGKPVADRATEALFPPGMDYLLIDDDVQIAGGSTHAIEHYAPLIESQGLPELDENSGGAIDVDGTHIPFTRFKASPQDASLLLFESPGAAATHAPIAHAPLPTEPLLPMGLPPLETPVAAAPAASHDEPWVESPVEGVHTAGGLTSLFDRLLDDGALFAPLRPDEDFVPPEATTEAVSELIETAPAPEIAATEGILAESAGVTEAGSQENPTPPEVETAEPPAEPMVAAEQAPSEDQAPPKEAALQPDASAPVELPETAAIPEPLAPAIPAEAEPAAALSTEEPRQAGVAEPIEVAAAVASVEGAPAEAAAMGAPMLYRVVGRNFVPLVAAPALDLMPVEAAPAELPEPHGALDAPEENAVAVPADTYASMPPEEASEASAGADHLSFVATPAISAVEPAVEEEAPADATPAFADAEAVGQIAAEAASPAVESHAALDAESAVSPSAASPDVAPVAAETSETAPPATDATVPEHEATSARDATPEPEAPPFTAPADAENVERVSRYNFDELSRILTDRVGSGDSGGAEGGRAAAYSPRPPLPSVPSATPEGALVTLGGETLVLNRLPLGILVFRDQQVLFGNRAITEMVGYDSVESLRRAGLAAIFPAAAGETQQEAGPVNHLVQRDGTLVPVTARLQSVSWQGKPALMLSASATEVRTAHETAVRAFAELLAQTQADGFFEAARSGVVTQASIEAQAILGLAGDKLIGRPLSQLVAPEDIPALKEFLERPARFAETARPAITLKASATGAQIQLFAQGQAGIVSSYFGFLRRTARGALPFAAPTPNEPDPALLARLSRGVRRPLNTVIGFSDLIGSAAFGPIDNARYLEYARDIKTAGLEIATLVDELDDFARLRDGRYSARPSDIDLQGLLESAIARVRMQANAARVLVRSAISEHLPRVRADRASLAQAVLNLLASAIDQTPQDGSVVLSAQVDDEGGIVVNVRDSARGTTDLGERFVVFRDGVGRDGETLAPVRSSVGLALTRALLAVNASTLSVDPAVGTGTLFSLTIPPDNVVFAPPQLPPPAS